MQEKMKNDTKPEIPGCTISPGEEGYADQMNAIKKAIDKDLLGSDFCQYDMCKCTDYCRSLERPNGENIIKADIILNAWLSYCRESRIYRILEFFGLR